MWRCNNSCLYPRLRHRQDVLSQQPNRIVPAGSENPAERVRCVFFISSQCEQIIYLLQRFSPQTLLNPAILIQPEHEATQTTLAIHETWVGAAILVFRPKTLGVFSTWFFHDYTGSPGPRVTKITNRGWLTMVRLQPGGGGEYRPYTRTPRYPDSWDLLIGPHLS